MREGDTVMYEKKRQINDKQQRFVDEYLVDLDATKAAIRAGYSAKTASQEGYKLVHKGLVAAAIARAMAERSRRTGIIADRVLRELALVAFCNPADVIDFDKVTVRPDATEDDRRCIARIKLKTMISANGDMIEREIKMCDKLKALDMLAKHLGMYDGVSTGEDGDDEKKQTGVVLLPPVQPLTPPADYESEEEPVVS